MDLVSLYYFTELAKDMHFTHTANRLFISQQTLSYHIHRLEQEFGMPLLQRKPTLSLTCAGEYVLSFAEKVNKEHEEIKFILSDIEGNERGTLRLGASAFRINAILPNVLPKFSKQYPRVEIRVTDANSTTLEPLVLDDSLDFAIVLSGATDYRLSSRHLIDDQLYLCVSDALLHQYYPNDTAVIKERAISGAPVELFGLLPICMMSNRMGRQLQTCFDEVGVVPRVYTRSTYSQIGISLCCKGLAACVASHMSLLEQHERIPKNVSIFPLRSKEGLVTQPLSIISKEKRYFPLYAQHFMDILTQNFFQLEHVHIARKGA